MEKLTSLEPSNSNESEDDCECPPHPPCQTVETIPLSSQLESKLTTLNQKIKGILSRLNTMENPYRTIFLDTDEISGGLYKIKSDITKF